ncbi:STAS/SEC14 domain-containing protein [Microbulbifer marinus]|uniref:SpoIIAA-like n=1 Tax=Microbulbifer marinus TaxID=658218 RepID=A0A1H3YKD4_9GAMM|nr:STAS/SEC14 domain-containing protein [Microbulbifer marinus]SEA12006.1 SpoIIAA-like [Microbulbifer marinus]
MSVQRHGVSIGLERIEGEFFLTMRVRGKLTHEDYASLEPMLESAIAGVENPKINVYFDATEMEGWEPRAAWDDFKLGVKHGREFNRVAMVGNRRWQEMAAKVGSWFIGGEARYFEDEGEAMSWLMEGT